MRQYAIWGMAALLVLASCKGSQRTAVDEKAQAEGRQPAIADQSNATNEKMGHGEVIGMKTVRGTLYHSKGRMGELGGMLISGDYLSDKVTGKWKPEYEALVGKQVEAHGEHYRYVCGPIEQCLEGGVMNYLQKVTYIKPVE
jgi:hypothetical protein